MLPDALFKPLTLQHVIEETERARGARGVVDLLVKALSDRRVRRDAEIDAYLDRLKAACRQTRRYAEILPVLKRIAHLNPGRRAEMAAEIALVHGHLRDRAAGVAVLRAALAEQLRLAPRRRSVGFCLVGEVAAAALGRPALAREIAAMGRGIAPDGVDYPEPLFLLDDLLADAPGMERSGVERSGVEHSVELRQPRRAQRARPRLTLVRTEAA
jgi:hypothetical protein